MSGRLCALDVSDRQRSFAEILTSRRDADLVGSCKARATPAARTEVTAAATTDRSVPVRSSARELLEHGDLDAPRSVQTGVERPPLGAGGRGEQIGPRSNEVIRDTQNLG
jgi:hypothetical protein